MNKVKKKEEKENRGLDGATSGSTANRTSWIER